MGIAQRIPHLCIALLAILGSGYVAADAESPPGELDVTSLRSVSVRQRYFLGIAAGNGRVGKENPFIQCSIVTQPSVSIENSSGTDLYTRLSEDCTKMDEVII